IRALAPLEIFQPTERRQKVQYSEISTSAPFTNFSRTSFPIMNFSRTLAPFTNFSRTSAPFTNFSRTSVPFTNFSRTSAPFTNFSSISALLVSVTPPYDFSMRKEKQNPFVQPRRKNNARTSLPVYSRRDRWRSSRPTRDSSSESLKEKNQRNSRSSPDTEEKNLQLPLATGAFIDKNTTVFVVGKKTGENNEAHRDNLDTVISAKKVKRSDRTLVTRPFDFIPLKEQNFGTKVTKGTPVNVVDDARHGEYHKKLSPRQSSSPQSSSLQSTPQEPPSSQPLSPQSPLPLSSSSLSSSSLSSSSLSSSLLSSSSLSSSSLSSSTLSPHPSTLQLNEVWVVIQVMDENDNAPQFDNDGRPLVGAVVSDARYGQEIFTIQATDKDAGAHSDVRFTMLQSGPADHARHKFAVDSKTGRVS
ncbi:Cadherin-like, partial [Trinorchestia longiramus]